MKKIIALVLVLCLALALCACGGGKAKEENNVIKIGVYEPQSGDNGAGGKQEILGMQYANYMTPTVDIGGKTYKVELVYADNESSNDKAVSAATTLISTCIALLLCRSWSSQIARDAAV